MAHDEQLRERGLPKPPPPEFRGVRRVEGIPCTLKQKVTRLRLRDVLRQIKEGHPKDFNRLRELVWGVGPYVDDDEACLGEWDSNCAQQYIDGSDPTTWAWQGWAETPGVLRIRENQASERLVSTIAHELGHAATRDEDLERRGGPSDEWSSELAADWYAYRWGFGREIAKWRARRDSLHHCAGPGQTVIDGDREYVVTRSFCMRLVRTATDRPDCS